MKKKTLGCMIIILEVLVVLYFVELRYGWHIVIKLLTATGTIVGLLVLMALFVVGFSLIAGDESYE